MHVRFDLRNLQPLGDAGTVYPNLRICDDWGILRSRNDLARAGATQHVNHVLPLTFTFVQPSEHPKLVN